ncbi:DNA polymerase III subunit beta, partial [bacterium]|nr:DNA polymerase III subunit beta [bacterium]
ALASILGFTQPICAKKTAIASTSYILFQITSHELIIKATDLEVSLQFSCPLQESTIDSLQILVPGKKIYDIVKELEGPIECKIEDNQFFIKNGKVNVALHVKSAEEFPPFPERIENLMQMDAKFILELFSKVSFLIPQNNSNPALNGLLIEISKQQTSMTTTDGHCLAQVKTTRYHLDEPKKWLVPRRGIFEIKKILENTKDGSVFLGICGNQLVFSGESFNFFTKVLADEFPAYEAILNKETFIPARVLKNDFIKTLRRSTCLLSGQFLATSFKFAKDTMKVTLKNNEIGKLEETLQLHDFAAEPLELRFYSPYLLNGLQSFAQDDVQLYLKNNTKPVIFEACNQDQYDLVYLVMPVSAAQV